MNDISLEIDAGVSKRISFPATFGGLTLKESFPTAGTDRSCDDGRFTSRGCDATSAVVHYPRRETDVLMVVTSIVLLLSVVMFGILFLRLHTLPSEWRTRATKFNSR